MTAKKKRLLFMVLGVCLCALIAVLIGERAISDNKKEYADAVNSLGFGQIRIRRYLLRYSG